MGREPLFGGNMFGFEDEWDEDFEEEKYGDFNCWACYKPVTYEQLSENDGECPHCHNEIELEEDDE
jgi:Zn finger protein HypA/HybF involved in hydrogenase expression